MFSSSYNEAKDKFLNVVEQGGYDLQSFVLSPGLTTEVATHINAKTKKLLVVNSGIHGVEGYFGAAVQTQWLQDHKAEDLPEDVGVIFVFASNPHGFANDHRVDASLVVDGIVHRVDPNRNFIANFADAPENKNYKSLEDTIIPKSWNWLTRVSSTARLTLYWLYDKITFSKEHFFTPALCGQYVSPDGMSFGGQQECWTNKVYQNIEKQMRALPNVSEIVFIDLHTGIGSKGGFEIYPNQIIPKKNPNVVDVITHPNLKEMYAKHPKIKVPDYPYPATGALEDYIAQKFSDKTITAFTIEAGTLDSFTVYNAMRGQNWQDKYGKDKKDITTEKMRAAFYPEHDKAWKDSVASLAKQIFDDVFAKIFKVDFVPKVYKGGMCLFSSNQNPQKKDLTSIVAREQHLATRP